MRKVGTSENCGVWKGKRVKLGVREVRVGGAEWGAREVRRGVRNEGRCLT